MMTEELTQAIEKFLEQHNHTIGYRVEFPQYRILPPEVKLALEILENHKMQVSVLIKPKSLPLNTPPR